MKYKFFSVALVLIISNAFISSAFAEVLIEAGIHTGGDEITLVNQSNAIIESTEAGSKYTLNIGGTKAFSDNIEAQFSLGIKSDASYGADQEASWVRYPVNAMVFYRTSKLRLGLGATVHLFPEFKVSGTAQSASTKYDDALGALFEIDYRLDSVFHIGLRYTDITYVSQTNGQRFDGSSVGLLIIVLI